MAQALAELVGLKALMKDVDRLCKDERSALFSAMKQAGYAAVKPAVELTRAALPRSDRNETKTHQPGALAASVRASAYRSGAAVRMGSKKVPYAGWMEFGGKRPDGSRRPYVKDGRYLWPAGREVAPHAVQQYTKAINELFGRTAIWTNSTTNPGSVHD